MDDLCVCLASPTNRQLDVTMGIATGTLLDIFKGLAMPPNLKPGKTALQVTPRGTQAWKKTLFGPLSPGTVALLGEWHTYQVPIVADYQHLGGVVHFSGSLRTELRSRFAIDHQAFGKHRRLLYHNRHFAMTKKRELFTSLIFSRLLNGSETWAG